MIVLDEQLLGYGLHATISAWYRGTVTDLPALRPGTVILDDAVPELLRAERQPTFVTINVRDCRSPRPHVRQVHWTGAITPPLDRAPAPPAGGAAR